MPPPRVSTSAADTPGPSRMRSHPHIRATAPTPSAGLSTSYDGREAYLARMNAGREPLPASRTMNDVDFSTPMPSPMSWTRSRPKRIEVPVDNWQLLREMVEANETEDAEEGIEALDQRSRRRMSIRSILSARSSSTARPLPVHSTSSDGIAGSITGMLSTSPPALAAIDSNDEEDGSRGIGAVVGERGRTVQTERRPLLDRQRSASRVPKATPDRSSGSRIWPPSPVFIAISKCCLAYFLGSMFTFIPALARILSTRTEQDAHGRIRPRPAYSAHMVATIVVYFHPAKSAGNMLLADRYAFILILFAALVCVLAMLTVHLFDHFSPSLGDSWDWISELGDWMVNILYIGGSMGVLAWAKIWVGNPSFNSGCSMAAVTIFSVVIKEGNVPKLLEILLIVLFGVLTSNIVCFTVFPTSATTRLQGSISRSLASFSTLLDLLTSTFLLEKQVLKATPTALRQAIDDHAKAFKTLKADLAEAKHERVLDPRIRGRKLKLYDAAIGSLARLAQHLSGMRGSTRLQETLLRASREGRINLDVEEKEGEAADDLTQNARLFMRFRELAGAQMNDLNACCDEALEAVKVLTRTSDDVDVLQTRKQLLVSLEDFSNVSSDAIKRLYAGPRRQQGVYGNERDDSSDEDLPAIGEIIDGPNETVFSIYFFLFTFEEFAREMVFLLDTVIEIEHADTPSVLDHIKSVLPFRRDKQQPRRTFLYQQMQNLVPIDPSKLQPPVFPRSKQGGSPGTGLPLYARLRKQWWAFGEWLRQPEIRYSIKIWIGGAILAAPAYTEWGRHWFLEFRGEWALIAFFSVNNPTLGQTNAMSFYRCAGTFIGAMVGVMVYNLFPENQILLPIAGFLFSIPCFYIVTQIPQHAQTGRFTILAYNLTCLYAYNSRQRDYSVWRVAIYRSVTVMVGALWAAIISRYWWPVTARSELRLGVSDFCLDLSYLYSRLVDANIGDSAPHAASGTETTPLLPVSHIMHPHLAPSVQQLLAMELHLQTELAVLRDLLVLTKNEPRLKGPFPIAFYREVLLSCERMLDRLHSMRCVTTRSEWSKGVRTEFDLHVSKERREMTGSVVLYLYTLSAGFRLRSPLPPYLPPAELNRQRLVAAIRELDVVKRRSARGGTQHLLFFAYALAMQEVVAELDHLGGMLQDNFGVIGSSSWTDDQAGAHMPGG